MWKILPRRSYGKQVFMRGRLIAEGAKSKKMCGLKNSLLQEIQGLEQLHKVTNKEPVLIKLTEKREAMKSCWSNNLNRHLIKQLKDIMTWEINQGKCLQG